MTDLPIEGLFHEKLLLYRELVTILKEEKRWIVKADVEALWRVSAQKKDIVAGIEGVRTRILDILASAGIDHGMTLQRFHTSGVLSFLPMEQRRRLSGLQVALATVKEEIRSIGKDNKHHIEACLSMLDDLMSVLMGTNRSSLYHAGRKAVPLSGPRLLHREA